MKGTMQDPLKTTLVLACCAILLAAAGCGERSGEPGGQWREYTVRAQVVKPPENPAEGLYLYHEPIDDWMGRSGKVEGMDPMAMPFPVSKDVPLQGLAANDKVEVTIHVNWEADSPVEIIRLRKLPPDTKLVFREAKPPRDS
jgi:hypothetical protein